MESVNINSSSKELSKQLEETLTRLALAADSGISTYHLEMTAQRLAGKLRSIHELFGGLVLYKGVDGAKEYYPESKLQLELFAKYADLCKKCHDVLEVSLHKDIWYAKVADNLYVCIADLADRDIPEFKIKIEGDTIIGMREDLLALLPEATKKLLTEGENNVS